MTALTKMTVPGMPTKFRFTVASSGVGTGATGGIFSTALCRTASAFAAHRSSRIGRPAGR